MNKTIKRTIFSILTLSLAISAAAANVKSQRHHVLPFAEGHGLAGAYIGALDDSTAIMAGGSDFKTLRPWEGGTKSFFGDIFILKASASGYECVHSGVSLPFGMGNGCGVVSGDALYCLGGLTDSGYSPAIIRITSGCECHPLFVEELGAMPDGFRANAAVSWAGDIYVHGSISGKNALYRFSPQSMTWTRMAACPERLLDEGSTFVVQHNGREDALYLIGGRGTDAEGLYISTNVWEYLPSRDSWERKASFRDGDKPAEIMYTASVPYGPDLILSFGCDDGVEFRRRIDLMAQGDRQDELTDAFVQHPGFSDRIWSYNAKTDVWEVLDVAAFPLPAVTTAVVLRGKVLLASGEEHPGVRNSDLIVLDVQGLPSKTTAGER